MIQRNAALIAALIVVVGASAQSPVHGGCVLNVNVLTCDTLENLTAAANQEIARTHTLLQQTEGDHGDFGDGWYGINGEGRKSILATRQRLEDALVEGKDQSIWAQTGALKNANDGLELFIQQRTKTATPPPPPQHKIDALLRDEDSFTLTIWTIVLVVFGFFSIPTLVAFYRRHRSRWVILVVNVLFGATVIGWIVALIWALNKVDDPVKGGIKIGPAPPDPVL